MMLLVIVFKHHLSFFMLHIRCYTRYISVCSYFNYCDYNCLEKIIYFNRILSRTNQVVSGGLDNIIIVIIRWGKWGKRKSVHPQSASASEKIITYPENINHAMPISICLHPTHMFKGHMLGHS